jgi:hypothetical protein
MERKSMSTETALAGRTIVIHQSNPDGGGDFQISVGDRHIDRLTSDEALWTIANLLMGKEPHYGLRTIDQTRDEVETRTKRRIEGQLRPFEKLITDKLP